MLSMPFVAIWTPNNLKEVAYVVHRIRFYISFFVRKNVIKMAKHEWLHMKGEMCISCETFIIVFLVVHKTTTIILKPVGLY